MSPWRDKMGLVRRVLTDTREAENAGRDHGVLSDERREENGRRKKEERMGIDSGWYDSLAIL